MIPRAAAILPLAVAALAGCGDAGPAPLLVVTSWDESERADAAARFEQAGGAIPIRWIVAGAEDDLLALAEQRRADAILGGSSWQHALWGQDGAIAVGPEGAPIRSAAAECRIVIDDDRRWGDPRVDAKLATWATRQLGTPGSWPGRFPQLLRRVATGVDSPGAARLEDAGTEPADWVEVASATAWSARPEQARRFVDAIALDRAATSDPGEGDAIILAADLLGALLTDAGEELRERWRKLSREVGEEEAARRLAGLPTWPPESVKALALAHPDDAESWLGTLAESLTSDAGTATWLVAQWMGPSRIADAEVLSEIAGARDGRLMREPRFRSWLRGEWAAWAQMRYRQGSSDPGGP